MTQQKSGAVLVVEDDLALQKQLKWSLDRFTVSTASERVEAMNMLRRHQPSVVTMDLGLPPAADHTTEGFALLGEILAHAPDTKVIVLTGQNDQHNALTAIDAGAYDFLAKPVDPDMLVLTVERALRLHELQQELKRLRQLQPAEAIQGLITRDPGMLKVCRVIEKVANTSATVMLLGESGTGKEVLARGLHQASGRRDGRFVAINCAAIPENLLETELFGHEKGAFTGAVKTTQGKIELADGGTLMLDEIGDLPLPLQSKLLRFLQERVVERVGGRQEIAVDVRIVCATHQDLKKLIAAGQFREDLFYRLAEIVVDIPPLRQRVGDPALIAHAFVKRFAAEQQRSALTLSSDAVRAIEAHPWPGNIRELENCIKRSCIMADGARIGADDLGLAVPEVAGGGLPELLDLRQAREEAERKVVIAALARVDGNVLQASELLGISRPTLYDLMHRLGLR